MDFHIPRSKTTFHQTTVELAGHQATSTLAGTKRTRSDEAPTAPRPKNANHAAFSRASALVNERPQLTPSAINDVGEPLEEGLSEYSQRKHISATPTPAVDPMLSLSHRVYGLPAELVTNFMGLGIKQIYPWQRNCLRGPGLLTGEKNLIYSAPTGGGKSLVADGAESHGLCPERGVADNGAVLMLKRVLGQQGAKALLVLPYVALVQEKVRWLRNIVEGIPRRPHESDDKAKGRWRSRADENTVRVAGFYGGSKLKSTWADFDIAVCTIEKASLSAVVSEQRGRVLIMSDCRPTLL